MIVVCVAFLLFILPCRSENVTQPKCNVTLPSDVDYYDIRNLSNVNCGCEKNCIRKCCLPGFLLTTVLYQSVSDGNETTIECVKWPNTTIPKFNVSFYDYRTLNEARILTNYSSGTPNCSLRQYTISENIYPQTDNRIYIHTDPKMYFETSEICLDDYYDDKVTTPKKIVIKCLAVNDPDFYFYCGCMIVSCCFLLPTFIILILQKNKSLHTKVLLFYIFNLFMAFITLLIIQLSPPFKGDFCVLVALLCLLFFISSISWITVICVDIYLKFSGFFGVRSDKQLDRKRFLWYTILAITIPIVLIFVVFLMNTSTFIYSEFNPNIGNGSCFLRKGLPYLLYLHGPVGLLWITNVTLFVLTALHIIKDKKATKVLRDPESSKSKADKEGYILYVTLLFAMGINWSLETIGWAMEYYAKIPKWFFYIPNTANMSYGVFIFFKFAWKKTWGDYLKERYYKLIGKEVANSKCSSVQTSSTTCSSNSVDNQIASSSKKNKQIASSNKESRVDVLSNIAPLNNIEKPTASSNTAEQRTTSSIQEANLDVPCNNVKNEPAPSKNMDDQTFLPNNTETQTESSKNDEKQTASLNQEMNVNLSSNNVENPIVPANNKGIVENQSVSPKNMKK